MFYSDEEYDEEDDDQQIAVATWCLSDAFPPPKSPEKGRGKTFITPTFCIIIHHWGIRINIFPGIYIEYIVCTHVSCIMSVCSGATSVNH